MWILHINYLFLLNFYSVMIRICMHQEYILITNIYYNEFNHVWNGKYGLNHLVSSQPQHLGGPKLLKQNVNSTHKLPFLLNFYSVMIRTCMHQEYILITTIYYNEFNHVWNGKYVLNHLGSSQPQHLGGPKLLSNQTTLAQNTQFVLFPRNSLRLENKISILLSNIVCL